jgi:hypothetical protein
MSIPPQKNKLPGFTKIRERWDSFFTPRHLPSSMFSRVISLFSRPQQDSEAVQEQAVNTGSASSASPSVENEAANLPEMVQTRRTSQLQSEITVDQPQTPRTEEELIKDIARKAQNEVEEVKTGSSRKRRRVETPSSQKQTKSGSIKVPNSAASVEGNLIISAESVDKLPVRTRDTALVEETGGEVVDAQSASSVIPEPAVVLETPTKSRTSKWRGNVEGRKVTPTKSAASAPKAESPKTETNKATHKRFGSEDPEEALVAIPEISTVDEVNKEDQDSEEDEESEDEAPEAVTLTKGQDQAKAQREEAIRAIQKFVLVS